MNTYFTAHPHRLTRLALLVALAVVLRFAAMELHHVLVEHQAGEHCELCLVMERGGHAAPAASFAGLPGTIACSPSFTGTNPVPARRALQQLPRGPPAASA